MLGSGFLSFNNVDYIDMEQPISNIALALEDFLPQSKHGHILFTTPNRRLAVELVSSDIIPISDINKTTALQILEVSLV